MPNFQFLAKRLEVGYTFSVKDIYALWSKQDLRLYWKLVQIDINSFWLGKSLLIRIFIIAYRDISSRTME